VNNLSRNKMSLDSFRGEVAATVGGKRIMGPSSIFEVPRVKPAMPSLTNTNLSSLKSPQYEYMDDEKSYSMQRPSIC
jgi:hypothetical protein